MSLMATIALIIGLGGRVLLNSLQAPTNAFAEPAASDIIILGLWQGAILHYAMSEYAQLAPVLGVALGVWGLADFVQSRDMRKIVMTVFSAVICVAALNLVSQVTGEEETVEKTVTKEIIRSPRSPTERGRSTRERHSRSSKNVRETVRESSPPRRVPFAGRSSHSSGRETHRTDDTVGTLDYVGHTGLEIDFELRLSNLRKRAASAEANRRRCKEERKWALDQGNTARAEQLTWQIKRYATIAESYTKEADRALIEATKHEAAGPPTRHNPTVTKESSPTKHRVVSNGHHHRYTEYTGNGNGFAEVKRSPSQLPSPPHTMTSPSRTYRDKGKTPIRTIEDYHAMQLPKSALSHRNDRDWMQ